MVASCILYFVVSTIKLAFSGASYGADIPVRLTAEDGKTLEGVIISNNKLQWRAVYDFANSEVVLEPPEIKEIVIEAKSAKTN